MATSFSIGTSRNPEVIRTRLGKEFNLLHNEGIDVSLEENDFGKYIYLDCSLDNIIKPEQEMIVRHYVANAVSDFILNQWEHLILYKMTKDDYYYLTDEEKEKALIKTKEILEQYYPLCDNETVLYRLNRKNKILHKVLDHLTLNKDINIDGFIKFRLQEYVDDLNRALEQAVDEIIMEKEYKEFIRLLKYFVDIQEPRIDKVHVILTSNNFFQLVDDDDKVINNEYLEGYIIEMIENEIHYEDLLISALITIAPNEIVMHIIDEVKVRNTVNTISGVFGDRVVMCNGCHRCTGENNKKH